jgi:hypothetical protein
MHHIAASYCIKTGGIMSNLPQDEKEGTGMVRITVSVPPEMYAAMKRIAELTNQPISKVMVGFLSDSIGVMEKTAKALEGIKKLKQGIGRAFGKKYGIGH